MLKKIDRRDHLVICCNIGICSAHCTGILFLYCYRNVSMNFQLVALKNDAQINDKTALIFKRQVLITQTML